MVDGEKVTSVVLSGLSPQWLEVPLSLVSYLDDEVEDDDDEAAVVVDEVVLSVGVLMIGLTGPVVAAFAVVLVVEVEVAGVDAATNCPVA